MEGVHTASGPWFTVHRSGDDWKVLEKIWVSNNKKAEKATAQARVRLEEAGNVK